MGFCSSNAGNNHSKSLSANKCLITGTWTVYEVFLSLDGILGKHSILHHGDNHYRKESEKKGSKKWQGSASGPSNVSIHNDMSCTMNW